MTTATIAPEIFPTGESVAGLVPFCRPSLYDELCRPEMLSEACQFVRDHPQEVSPQGVPFEVWDGRHDRFLEELEWELRSRTYRPGPVFRVCRVRRRARNECVRVLRPRDRVVCVALLLTLRPVLEVSAGNASRKLAVIEAALRSGYYRVLPSGGNDALARDTLGSLLRLVTVVVHDEAVLDLIKRLLRAPLVEEIRLAS